MEPQKFGRYEIKAEVGRGGMATVYHAYDPRFEREVAIKVLPREMLHDPQFRTRFEREAKTVAMLEHPAIVPVYDFGEEDGQPYFVMRYMTGGSLSDRMKKGPLSIQEAARILAHIAPALDEAHARGIIHRDLKPGNILFDQYNEPYVSDFGIAKLSEAQTNVTGSAIVGTPAYMSPEQAQGESIDGRSDIYGLGVILFELLSGQQPYHGDTPMSVVVKHITDPVPHILDIKPDLPSDIEAVIEKAMAKDRNERFQTVKSLAEALNAVARGESPDLGTVEVTLVTPSKTVTAKRPSRPLPETVIAGRTQQPEGREQVQDVAVSTQPSGPAAPRKKRGVWIGLGAVVLLIFIAAVAGFVFFRDQIPFLAAPTRTFTPTQTKPVVQGSPTLQVLPATDTPGAVSTPIASDIPLPSSTATVPQNPSLGGADLIAFLSANDIWVMGADGSGLHQLTADGAAKHDLQWSPDGQSVFFISGKCIRMVDLQGGNVKDLTCFNAAQYLDAFEISPDGSQVAISVDRMLYVVSLDLTALGKARNHAQLRDMKGCFTYDALGTKGARWSNDGGKLAVEIIAPEAGRRVDMVRVFDISHCASINTFGLDTFPGPRFTMNGYAGTPLIPSFDWDGESLFLLNSVIRNDTYGYLYSYNFDTLHAEALDPLGTACCYSDARWSPDGTYVLFSYQNLSLGSASKNLLYYVPYGSIGTGATYTPLSLPDDFLSNPRDHPDAALRPVE